MKIKLSEILTAKNSYKCKFTDLRYHAFHYLWPIHQLTWLFSCVWEEKRREQREEGEREEERLLLVRLWRWAVTPTHTHTHLFLLSSWIDSKIAFPLSSSGVVKSSMSSGSYWRSWRRRGRDEMGHFAWPHKLTFTPTKSPSLIMTGAFLIFMTILSPLTLPLLPFPLRLLPPCISPPYGGVESAQYHYLFPPLL